MSLADWANNGWLRPHKTSPQEIADLLGIVERDLADAAELVEFTEELRADVLQWLKQHHSHLLPKQ